MNRLQFIQNLIGLYGISSLPIELSKEFQKIYLLQFFVRGFQFYKGPKIINQINENDLVDLVREPNNEYDEYAIAIHYKNTKIGYVPREDNVVLSNLLDAKLLDLQAEITHVEPKTEKWENIHVAIYALKEKSADTPSYLTKVYPPTYCTLQLGEKEYQRVYFEDTPMINGEIFYEMMLENSSTDKIYDIIHTTFNSSADLELAVNEGRILINKNHIKDFNINEIGESIDNQLVEIEGVFDRDGYIIANINKIADMPDKIDKIVRISDKLGRDFYEIFFKN